MAVIAAFWGVFAEKDDGGFAVIYMLFAFFAGLVGFIFEVGFLRTVYLEGEKTKLPARLFSAGRPFFWRILVFTMIVQALMMLLFQFFAVDQQNPLPAWIPQAAMVVIQLVFIRFMIFIEPAIIAADISVIQSLKKVKTFSLFKAPEIIVLFSIQMAIAFTRGIFTPDNADEFSAGSIVLNAAEFTVEYLINLMIMVCAMIYVAQIIPPLNTTADVLEEKEINDSSNE
jgi:hypothetical protein